MKKKSEKSESAISHIFTHDKDSPFYVSSKQKLVLVTLIKQLMEQLDEVTSRMKQGEDYSKSFEIFKDMSLVLEHIPPHLQNAYLELLPVLVKGDSARNRNQIYSQEYVELSFGAKQQFIIDTKKTLKEETPFRVKNQV